MNRTLRLRVIIPFANLSPKKFNINTCYFLKRKYGNYGYWAGFSSTKDSCARQKQGVLAAKYISLKSTSELNTKI